MSADSPVILVTGAGGFIGAAVAKALRDDGFGVRMGTRRAAPGGTACDLDKPGEARAI